MLHTFLLFFLHFSLVNSIDFSVIHLEDSDPSADTIHALAPLFYNRVADWSLSSLVKDPERRILAISMLSDDEILCQTCRHFTPLTQMFDPNNCFFNDNIINFFKGTKKAFRNAVIEDLPVVEAVAALFTLKPTYKSISPAFSKYSMHELYELVIKSFNIKLQFERKIGKKIEQMLQDSSLTENERNTFWFTDGRKRLELDL